jgi:hypothetical protein
MGAVATSIPSAPARSRPTSGTIFVLACVTAAVAFVAFLVFVSPRLLDWTRASAPPAAPQVVASGEIAGRPWSAQAVDATAGQRVVGSDGIEPVVEPEPCLRVEMTRAGTGQLCVQRLGGTLRGMQVLASPDGAAVLYGVVAARVAEVVLESSAGEVIVEPSYVDFGFPLGFFAVPVDAGTSVRGARALDADGAVQATTTCSTALPTLRSCRTSE